MPSARPSCQHTAASDLPSKNLGLLLLHWVCTYQVLPASRPRRNLALTKGAFSTFLPSLRDYLRPRHFLALPLGPRHTAELSEVLSVSGYHARTQLPFDGKTSQ